ncbi:Hypothetical predicted protein, partial [Paramuricea clavata]
MDDIYILNNTLDEIERSQIEEIAQVPNVDNMTVCSCRGMCSREKGRNACPCKGIGHYCSSVCHPESQSCMNRQNIESDTDEDTDSFETFESQSETQELGEHDTDDDDSEKSDTPEPQAKRARGRTSGLSRGARGRVRGHGRGPRGRGRDRGRGRGRLIAEDNSEQRLVAHEQQLQ